MINIALTGLTGYGAHFLESLLEGEEKGFRLAAVVSRNAKKSGYYEELVHRNVKLYSDLENCLKENEIQLVLVTTPMHIHYKEVMTSLKYGANVYCEKPLAPTIQECIKIRQFAEEQNRIVAVGFQWSFSEGICKLKDEILSGKYKRIKRIKAMACLNRKKSYFEGSAWKGKWQLENGQYILESVMSNCAVHFLHNLFFLAGETMEQSAQLTRLEGEGYQAHHVEGYDTVFIRMQTKQGIELLYYATMVAEEQKTPMFEVELEEATVTYPVGDEKCIELRTKDGEVRHYPCPDIDRFIHYQKVVKAIQTGENVVCDVATVMPEVIAVNAMAEAVPVRRFEEEMIEENETDIYVKGIAEVLEKCYQSNSLPFEMNMSFSKGKYQINTTNYVEFQGGKVQ